MKGVIIMNKEENIFITYEDVVKSSSIKILSDIIEKYQDCYKGFINFDLIRPYTSSFIEYLIFFLTRENQNILYELRSINYDTNKAWNDIHKRNIKLYENSLNLSFYDTIKLMDIQDDIKHIYLWTDTYDERIHRDISETIGFYKTSYVTGDFRNAINKFSNINTFVINDINLIHIIKKANLIQNTSVFIANYRYNYIVDEGGFTAFKIDNLDKYAKDNSTTIRLFQPIKIY
jgi:hypothetical protein